MLGDVYVNVQDGNLKRTTVTGTGVQVKIGVSEKIADEPIEITNSMTAGKIKEMLGYSPLADACMDSIENGAGKVYCVPVNAETAGTISEVQHTGSGSGTVTVTGKPHNAYTVIISIIETGTTNAGGMKYSIDGGITYSDEMTIPEGKTAIPETGIEISMTGDFTEGDIYQVTTTAPKMNHKELLSAVENLKNFTKVFEMIHVVGATEKATWAALAALAAKFMEEYKKPVIFICESSEPSSEETAEQYAEKLINDRKGINSIYVQVVAAWGYYKKMDNREVLENLAGVITGLYGAAKESQSVGEVASFPIANDKLISLVPAGIGECIPDLDEAGYCTVRQYNGLEDYYVTNAKMFSAENSDFRYAEETRVQNRLVRDIRKAALEKLHVEIDMSNIEASFARIQEELNVPIDNAVADGIISSGRVTVDVNENILVDEEMNAELVYVPKGHIRTIHVNVAVDNPYNA